MRIKVGQAVTFQGSFASHPLAQACGPTTVIHDGTGSTVTVTFPQAGLYGYYCTDHGGADGSGMAGAILVER